MTGAAGAAAGPDPDHLGGRRHGRATGPGGGRVTALVVLGALLVAAVVLGAVPAHLAARRTPRDELRVETRHATPRAGCRAPTLAALVRTDRASVWRAVPMRRGLAVLAIGPGLVAVARQPAVELDDRAARPGRLRRRPAVRRQRLVPRRARRRCGARACRSGPSAVFAARAYVLAEFLLAASVLTVALAALRAGVPSPAELTALLCTRSWSPSRWWRPRCAGRPQRPYAVTCARPGPRPPRRWRWSATRPGSR